MRRKLYDAVYGCTGDISTTDYQQTSSMDCNSIAAVNGETEASNSDWEGGKVTFLNNSSNVSSLALLHMWYVWMFDISHEDNIITVENLSGWYNGNKLICHHFYCTRHISRDWAWESNKIQEDVANHDNITSEEMKPVLNTNYDFENQFSPSLLKYRLENIVKESQ